MSEEEPEPEVIDVEWEILILKSRTRDLLGQIDELRATDKSLKASIAKLRYDMKHREVEEGEEEWEEEREEIPEEPPLHRLLRSLGVDPETAII